MSWFEIDDFHPSLLRRVIKILKIKLWVETTHLYVLKENRKNIYLQNR